MEVEGESAVKALVIAICVIVFAGSALALWACCAVAGKYSRQGERLQLKPCPVCQKVPKLGYCYGEYYVSGDDSDCPGCGTAFTEMHSSPELEIEAWNRRVEDGK